jgi:3-hydroxyacyl-CoA dehydrogenase
MAIKMFQDNDDVRSSIPVIVAPHGMTLVVDEMSLHADKVVAAAETYMGLVEFGVGVFLVVVVLRNCSCVHQIYSIK